jgi:hypothetical protein
MARATQTRVVAAKPQNDVYTGLLAIALVAMIASCVLLFLDYSQYPETTPKVSIPKAPVAPAELPPIGTGAGGGGGEVPPPPPPPPGG